MEAIFGFAERYYATALRMSLALVLGWIGSLKFVSPQGVVDLLNASLPFLAFTAFVYVLGMAELTAAVLLVAGVGLRWVGLLCVGLFLGTLTIFTVAPMVSFGDAGFPFLTLAGEFLIKDVVLLAASLAVTATAAAPQAAPAVLSRAGAR